MTWSGAGELPVAPLLPGLRRVHGRGPVPEVRTVTWQILQGDVRAVLPTLAAESVNCVVTSPPYWGLRDYGVDGQIGQEASPEEFVATMVEVFREVRRVLRKDGTLWLNLGDSYARSGGAQQGERRALRHYETAQRRNCRPPSGLKHKDLVGIPWATAFALRADGWWLRSEVIWNKLNPQPENVTDRPSREHEHVFLLTKSAHYAYDKDAVSVPIAAKTRTVSTTPTKGDGTGSTGEKVNKWMSENGGRYHPERRNMRTVWAISPRAFAEAHFAVFPPQLAENCILAGCPEGGVVLDPFSGSGTTGMVAQRHGRGYVGIELNPEYVEMSRRRIDGDAPLLNVEALP